jgi:hypothetical protein
MTAAPLTPLEMAIRRQRIIEAAHRFRAQEVANRHGEDIGAPVEEPDDETLPPPVDGRLLRGDDAKLPWFGAETLALMKADEDEAAKAAREVVK